MRTSEAGFNFVIGDADFSKDTELFFGDEHVEHLPNIFKWEDVAIIAGFFPSKSQARKNGWFGEIRDGWSERGFGKIRKDLFRNGVWILKRLNPVVDCRNSA